MNATTTWTRLLGNVSASGHEDAADNNDDDDDDEYLFDRVDVRATFIALYTVVFTLCVFGNLLVIVVVSLSRRMRSLTNLFLVNLAVADLCVGLFCVYQNLSIYLVQSWALGDVVCKLYHFVHNLSYTASIFVLVVVGVERYLAVLHPMRCRSILTPARLKLAAAAVWLASAALCGSRLYWAQTVTVQLPARTGPFQEVICISNRHKYDQRTWDVLSFVLLYAAPLGVLAYLYARIAAVLWGSGRDLGRQQASARVARRGVVKLIVVVVGVFAVCHLPLHGRRLWQHWSPWYSGPSSFSAIFTPATFLVAYANSAANPVLYALLSNNFRAGMRDVLARFRFRSRTAGAAGSLNSSRNTASTELQLTSLPSPRRPGRVVGDPEHAAVDRTTTGLISSDSDEAYDVDLDLDDEATP